ncbi:breast cancer type 2 susceptibility protein homolog isoform X28 [Aphis gossypii]|uniref:breast cancer type 2 susceptibility protein homolog isoform X27 n=1 Tax=Aphis gossypii TaxID=80765 RepID=UPI002159A477|nr:breast cancer type 2 susceptibility protein homolog isoform X27 [Aphis gossypii]XP_050067002.1 breast cancer type 2 susceptibility protein homolog isoform X28 [Aphis gossypii]
MEKQNKSHEMKQNLRAKSPTVKSALQDCSILNISNPHNLNSIKKENQEMKVLTVSTPTIHQPKTLKNLNLLSNLQSTPNTRHFNKSEMDSRIIMNLSPIMSTSTLKQNLYNHKDIYQHKSHTDIDFSLNPLKYQNSSNLCKNHELNKWKTNKTLIGTTHKSNIINSTILPENTRQTNEDNINEKAKRCLFEENKTVNNISNLETDQDSLNISLDILEQVCQMSEIMDDSLTEEVKINVDNDKKKKKLAFFLYGNSTPKLEDTEEENKLLQWALSMEDNVLSESRSNNKLCSEKEFTSLNQLKNKETNLSKYGSEQSKSNKLNTYISDSKCNFFDPEDINEIGNTQMCEIADMTEPLESFDDQWTQQYTSCNVSNLSSKVKENHFHKNSDEVINTSIDFIGDKINIKKCNLLDNTNEKLEIFQSIVKNELIESRIVTPDDIITNDSIYNGFFTAGGKLIKVSDEALQKVQTLLKDELTESSTVTKGTTSTKTNTCKGFSTAGGKSIKISDTALQKVQTLLKDELTESSTVTKGTTSSKTNICKGFSTAGGKSIKISDTALQKVQTLLKDELTESSTVPKGTTSSKTNTCKGFSTAGGKSIKISDTALQKVQTLLKDELTESSTVTKGTTSSKTNTCKGFSTAGGKSIKISDTALQKVQTLLKDELTESSTVTKGTTSSKTNTCKGFSTAGGKSIKISDTALQKVQTLLKDELTESSTVPKGTTSTKTNTCKGFSTAGGKSIKISDTALQKVQTMLKDELTESSTVTKDTTSSKTKIFNQLLNAEDKSIKKLDMLLQKDQVTYKDDKQLFDSSLKTIDIPNDCNNLNRASKSINNLKTKSNCFEILKHEEENTFEDDLSLINTVEKFERDQIVCKPVLRNKRPGSPINKYEIDYKIKKTVHNERWEIDELNISFNDYLSKKLYGPKVSLPEVVDWNLPKMSTTKQFPENGIAKELIKLGIDNATNLKLYWEKNYKLSDGHKNKMYNFQDIKYFFLLHNFVDGKLIPNRWIENHFRFIVWKLAATEIFFPDQFGNKLLTAKNIIHQLLYRYYREIEKCQRSALKKILEKDEATSKRIVLCVSKVNKTNLAETYTIELTDGWYSVQGIIDYEMNMLLHKGIVKVGTKLIVYNAELIGAGEGIDPLDVHNGVKLKISTNSTRRVRWYTKLGFYKNSTLPIPITLESVLPHGGIIGSLSLVILRKYPIMFLEKKTSSKSIFRNEKMEIIEAEKYKAHQQKALEIISNNIKSELIAEMASKTNSVSKKYISNMKKENLDTLNIDELSNILENSTDPLEIQSLLSQEKLEALEDFKKSEQERFYNELQNRVNKVFNDQFKDARKVIPMIKLRVVDKKYASTGVKAALLTIWNPSEDVTDILNKSTEGQCCTFHHITANGFMNGELQLSANKNTRFNFQECTNEYAKRDVVSFKNIWSGTFLPLFGELDFVGIVISNVNKNNAFNEVYVSDKEMNIISILFRGNIKEYGYDDMIYPGSILSGINIQFKGFNPMSSIPKLYTTEQSLFTTNPKTDYILNIFNDYKMFIKMPENQDFLVSCQTKLNEICNGHGETTMINNEQCLNKSRNALHRSYGELPVTVVRTSNTPQSEFSPVQKRIKMLNAYGKTPPLNIVHTKPPDKKLMGQFKTPTRL